MPRAVFFFALASITVAEYFGTVCHGIIFGILAFTYLVGGAVGPLVGGAVGPLAAGMIFDHTGSYQLVFLILTLIGLFGLLRPRR